MLKTLGSNSLKMKFKYCSSWTPWRLRATDRWNVSLLIRRVPLPFEVWGSIHVPWLRFSLLDLFWSICYIRVSNTANWKNCWETNSKAATRTLGNRSYLIDSGLASNLLSSICILWRRWTLDARLLLQLKTIYSCQWVLRTNKEHLFND